MVAFSRPAIHTQIVDRERIMRPAIQLKGYLHQVDPIAREIHVFVNGHVTAVDVPIDCDIRLNQERVKFRLLQRWDLVAVDCLDGPGGLVAGSIRVGWEATRSSATQLPPASCGNV
jgi:hypothetical protein